MLYVRDEKAALAAQELRDCLIELQLYQFKNKHANVSWIQARKLLINSHGTLEGIAAARARAAGGRTAVQA